MELWKICFKNNAADGTRSSFDGHCAMTNAEEENDPKNVVSSFISPSPRLVLFHCKFSVAGNMSRGILRGEYEEEKYIQSIALSCYCNQLLF